MRHHLVLVSHVSAPFITTFLLIHLSAPVLANVGGSSLSSQVMLLGREYYQTALGEPYLILGPIAVHALSGIIRRALITYPKLKTSSAAASAEAGTSSTFLQRIRTVFPVTTLSVTAYSILLLLPIHFGINRILPTTAAPPVLSLGPSELDYSFVQYGLQRWPIRTWAMYIILVGTTVTHAVEGARVLMGSFSSKSTSSNSVFPNSSKLRRKLLAASLALPVLSGLYFLYTEPLYIFPDLASRLEGVYQLSWFYRVN
ncbi:hypothetical protein BT96DRAFT_1050619 [Gymnopus androsaceus JB14]|uniref:Mitochondrial adapter protein MCP1 transmembrane domain-containing protein n=1 Tax=Gymnopus androsaceus JB14 TaxID=1447944 RepID=A0A6A4H6E1_9AGAR|nr:hypothetical protein BT96DRAFT_1050619 [Gymnopus androsaceus JB14]